MVVGEEEEWGVCLLQPAGLLRMGSLVELHKSRDDMVWDINVGHKCVTLVK